MEVIAAVFSVAIMIDATKPGKKIFLCCNIIHKKFQADTEIEH